MRSAQFRRHAGVMVASFVVLIGAGGISSLCFAQEAAPQTPKSQEKQAQTPKSHNPADTSLPTTRMADGTYKVGNGVSPPKLIYSVDAKYPPTVPASKVQGICVVKLVVDENGMPQKLEVEKPVEDRLDESAIEAVKQYRFRPATFRGKPVPIVVRIEVNFRLP